MKYLVLLIGDGDEPDWSTLNEEEQAATMQKFADFDAACAARDGVEILAGEALRTDGVTTVRPRAGRREVTEGPFAEVIEGLGGFFLMATPDLDTLLELLTVLPAYDIQLSPVDDMMDAG